MTNDLSAKILSRFRLISAYNMGIIVLFTGCRRKVFSCVLCVKTLRLPCVQRPVFGAVNGVDSNKMSGIVRQITQQHKKQVTFLKILPECSHAADKDKSVVSPGVFHPRPTTLLVITRTVLPQQFSWQYPRFLQPST